MNQVCDLGGLGESFTQIEKAIVCKRQFGVAAW